MKKTFGLVIGFCLLASIVFCAFNVYAADGDVEIKFAVGDSTLSINGEEVTVTTPYVVDGTTLVPVRVITEAFGAEVIWHAEDKSVTVNYSDVAIKLAIGNKTAYINGNPVELLAAPELTNSTTMLPLRFITESFGADVTYDESTASITVVKQMTISNSIRDYSLILKRSDKEMVGDSYLNWSMAHSPEMKLSFRSFDGTENIFTNDDETGLISVYATYFKDGETVDDVYEYFREMSQNFAVSKFEKAKSSSGVDYVVVRYSTTEGYYERRTYIKGEKGFTVIAALEIVADRSVFDELASIISTFDMKYDFAKTEDLSDVNTSTGNHTYTSDYFAIEIDVPGYLYLMESSTKENSVDFYDLDETNPVSYISLDVYSAYEGHDAKSWVEVDHKNNKATINEKFATFSEVKEQAIGGKTAYVYEYVETHEKEHEITYDMFIDAGDYFYNIAIIGKKGKVEAAKDIICKSIVFKEIDAEKVGQLIRTDDLGSVSYKDYQIKSAGIKFNAPTTWENISEDQASIFLGDVMSGRDVVVTTVNKSTVDNMNLLELSRYMYNDVKSNALTKMIDSAPKKVDIDKKSGYCFQYTTEIDEEQYLYTLYIFGGSSKYILVQLSVPEYANGTKTQEIFNEIIGSLEY